MTTVTLRPYTKYVSETVSPQSPQLTKAGWAALRSHVFGEVPAGGKAGVTNAVNQGVLTRTEVGIEVTDLGREVATRVWG